MSTAEKQLSLRLRDSGEKRATDHLSAVSRYSLEAVELEIRQLAERGEFTTDSVWDALHPITRDTLAVASNALGGIMTKLARRGIIHATGRTVMSERESGRGRRVMIWRKGPRYG